MRGNQGYKVRTVKCELCGRSRTGHMPDGRRFCSLSCYRTAPRPERKTGREVGCALCGSVVYVSAGRLRKGGRLFCSRKHANEWQGRNKTTHACKVCGRAFRWSPSRAKANRITYCSLRCRDADPARRVMLIAMNAAQQRVSPNKVERAGYAMLDSLGVAYKRQHLIGGKFCVDAFVSGRGVVVQFDGDYWHGNPSAFPEPDNRQRRRMRLDKSQDAYMRACGYSVIRIWASDLEKRISEVTARLQPLLTRRGRARAVRDSSRRAT